MNKIKKFSCGCQFNIHDNGLELDIAVSNINIHCDKTWDLISSGNTKGCFQLESRLGQSMAKQLKPSNIEQLAGLISIMRPGCLEAYRDGKSVSNHYIDKKNGDESVDFFHPCLETILGTTYGEMVYQEQAMQICQLVANFDLEEADKLRKAIGKKNAAEMKKLKSIFVKKSKQVSLLNKDESHELFSWIEKSQRYSFNKSHAISYAYNAYLSAYIKTHFPKHFFTAYLRFAKDKIDPLQEIQELVNNATEMSIDIKKPSISNISENFFMDKDNSCIRFGMTNIKGLGLSVYQKISEILTDTNIENFSFFDLYYMLLRKINSASAKGLIASGAIDLKNITYSRNEMLFYLDILENLTDRELDLIHSNITQDCVTIQDVLNIAMSPNFKITKKRRDIISSLIKNINKPAYSLEDTAEWIANNENFYLGIAITCKKIDGCDIMAANAVCRDLNKNSKINVRLPIVGAEIGSINTIRTKRGLNPGQEMAFINILDSTGACDVVVFPQEYNKYKHLLFDNNTLMIQLESSKKGSFMLKKCWQV